MTSSKQSPGVIRFGVFEVDLRSGELRKDGLKVRLQEQPFRVLALLLEKPGEIVTREELREKLWAPDTYVDFDKSLNTTVNKLREALGDSAENPRFVQTLHRRGYRFIAPVERFGGVGAQHAAPAVGTGTSDGPSPTSTPEHAGVPHAVPGLGPQRSQRFQRIGLLTAVALLGAVVGIIVWQALHSAVPAIEAPLRRFAFTPRTNAFHPVISPNGRHIAYVSGGKLWVQDLDREEPRAFESNNVGSNRPFWSPDSKFIGFITRGWEDMRKVAVEGGASIKLCQLLGPTNGGTWSPDGSSIVFGSGNPSRLYEVPAQGGSPKLLLDQPMNFRVVPHFLPRESGGRSVVFAPGQPAQIEVLNVDTISRDVLTAGARAVYSSTGHLVYQAGGRNVDGLWALPFSPETLNAAGEPFPVNENGSSPSVARDGTLAYLEAGEPGLRQLTWRDRSGRAVGTIGRPQPEIGALTLSPDGSRVAVAAVENKNRDIWVHEVASGLKTRLTFHSSTDQKPVWSPSGASLAFGSLRNGTGDIFTKAADGAGEVQELLSTAGLDYPYGWSRDEKYLLYHTNTRVTRSDIWYLQRKEGEGGYETVPFLNTAADEQSASLSPDSRFVAYESDESGSSEIYVRSFPDGGGKRQVSTGGERQVTTGAGRLVRWRGDGKELFYREGNTLVAVSVTTAPGFSVGGAEWLFDLPPSGFFDVSADGQRFIVVETLKQRGPPTIRVVQNWYEEFRDQHAGK